MNSQRKTQRVYASLSSEAAKQLEEIAKVEDRSIPQQISRYIRLGIEHDLKKMHKHAA